MHGSLNSLEVVLILPFHFHAFPGMYLIGCSVLISSCFQIEFCVFFFISRQLHCLSLYYLFFLLHLVFVFSYYYDLRVGSSLPIPNTCVILSLKTFFISFLFTPTIFIKTLFMLVYAFLTSSLILLSNNIFKF